jgi:DTW domain-containing protein
MATRVIVVMHSKEWRRTSNTGHFARLAIKGAEVRMHGAPNRLLCVDGIESAPSTLVLFPGRGAEPLSLERVVSLPRPITLLVPDGNWNQTQHMMRRLPILRAARPVHLDGARSEPGSLRTNSITGRMSTFEALAHALGILESVQVEDALLSFYRQVLGRITPNSRRLTQRTLKPRP